MYFFQVTEDGSVQTIEPEPKFINVIEDEDWWAPIMAYFHYYYELVNNTEHVRMQ
jgi:hypothetical protein